MLLCVHDGVMVVVVGCEHMGAGEQWCCECHRGCERVALFRGCEWGGWKLC